MTNAAEQRGTGLDERALRIWAQGIVDERDDEWPANRIAHSTLAVLDRVAELEAALTGWHWQYHGRGTVPPESCPNHLCQSWQAIEKNSSEAKGGKA